MSRAKELKTHLLNVDNEIMCGIPESWGRPVTARMIETTCKGCIEKIHPIVKEKFLAELEAIERGG